MKIFKLFTTPKLCTCKNDITKEWFVYFYYTDESTKTKKLFRYKLGLNRFKTKKERVAESTHVIKILSDKLEFGWNPITDKIEKTREPDKTLSEVFDDILALKKAYITARSYKTYYDQINLFKKWLKSNRYDYLYPQNFTANHARTYFDWLLTVKKYCGKTYNGHLTVHRTFYNCLIERGYITVSPVANFKPARQDAGKNTTYSGSDQVKFEQIKKSDPKFYLATRFVKYCFLRRSELARLQVKHINWDNKTIIIPSENSKSRVQDSVTIPKSLERLLEECGAMNLSPETYLFGAGKKGKFSPSGDKLKRVDDLSDKQRIYNTKLGISRDCTFYSWKHTGVVELYNLTKDPYIVMRQCRHSDIKMTMIYLRSLGCGVNESVRAW